jgi:glycosyltransferase involved in cell wall biosynthesis
MTTPADADLEALANLDPCVSVVIPARNEADRIAETVRAAAALPLVRNVIVVDDGSTDDTAQVARAAGALVERHPRNRGKAAAMETGAARANEAANSGDARCGTDWQELLLFLDADLGDTAREAAVLIAPVALAAADMTVATFPENPGRGGGMGVVVRVSRGGIRRATGRVMKAPLSGQRCLRRAVFLKCLPLARGFGVETALTIDALRAGYRVEEVATAMDHRVTGRDLAARLHRARQLRDVARALAPRLLTGDN